MSKIEWTQKTWNPTTGCSRVSPGCDACYAMHFARRFDGQGKGYDGTTRNGKKGVDWTGVVNLHPDRLEIPLRRKKPTVWFVDSMSDLFHPAVPFDFIDKVFAVMALCPQHTFQVLTKRPERMAEYFDYPASHADNHPISRRTHVTEQMLPHREVLDLTLFVDRTLDWPLPNVWLGTSVENQQYVDERIPHLLRCPARVRFLSCEPLLGPVDFNRHHRLLSMAPGIDWVIAGGESGIGARPMHPDWARSLRDQCEAADVPYFFKQIGRWLHVPSVEASRGMKGLRYFPDLGETFAAVGKKRAGRLLDGRTHDALPAFSQEPTTA